MVFLCLTYRYCTILCKSSYWMNRLFLIMLSIITGTVTKQILARWKLKFSVFIILCAKLSIIGDFKTGSHTVKYRYLLNSWLWTRIRNHCTVSRQVNSWIFPSWTRIQEGKFCQQIAHVDGRRLICRSSIVFNFLLLSNLVCFSLQTTLRKVTVIF